MIEATIGNAAALAGLILDPGWYGWKVLKVEPKPQAKDPSKMNIWITLQCLTAKDASGRDIEGLETSYRADPSDLARNTIGTQTQMKFLRACIGEELGPGTRINYEGLVDSKVDGYCSPREYEGKTNNDFQDFAKFGSRAK